MRWAMLMVRAGSPILVPPSKPRWGMRWAVLMVRDGHGRVFGAYCSELREPAAQQGAVASTEAAGGARFYGESLPGCPSLRLITQFKRRVGSAG